VIDALRAEGLTVLADDYSPPVQRTYVTQDGIGADTRPPGRLTVTQGRLETILAEVAREFAINWKFDGDALLIRHPHWYHWERSEVPYRLLRRWEEWRSRQAPHSAPDLDLLLEMVTSLTPDQLRDGLIRCRTGSTRFLAEAREIERLKPFLSFYAALSVPQRFRLRRTGLSLAGLTPSQIVLLRRAGAWPGAQGIAVRTIMTGSGPGNAVTFF
jgi:hypothetical protein